MNKILFLVIFISAVSATAKPLYDTDCEGAGCLLMITSSPTLSYTGLTLGTTGKIMNKVILDAKDDLEVFVGSQGQRKGAYAGAALEYYRKQVQDDQSDDLQLAQEILGML
jgi:uncharacterized protein (TIGR02448 family)